MQSIKSMTMTCEGKEQKKKKRREESWTWLDILNMEQNKIKYEIKKITWRNNIYILINNFYYICDVYIFFNMRL